MVREIKALELWEAGHYNSFYIEETHSLEMRDTYSLSYLFLLFRQNKCIISLEFRDHSTIPPISIPSPI